MIYLTIVALVLAVPSIKRILKGDYKSLFWVMSAIDIVIVMVAVMTRNLVIVVTVQVIANTLINLLDQRRIDQIYNFNGRR